MPEMDTIKVGVRVRPLLEREVTGTKWVVAGNAVSQIGQSARQEYCFDYVFDEKSQTEHVFQTLVQPIVSSFAEGFNATIFAYGQTSSGKTHTMLGTTEEMGITPCAMQYVFQHIEKHPEREFIIRVSYLEIYNENLMDLLDPANKSLRIIQHQQRGVVVDNLTEVPVTDPIRMAEVLYRGNNNRSIGCTQMNEKSSRSHAIFSILLESRVCDQSDSDTVNVSCLNLVDLAGSERVSATGTEGVRFKEGVHINLSLLTLGNVINKLAENKHKQPSGGRHLPFRDSKLTRILEPSLGGNAKTAIICTITPAEITETISTLNFASRAMHIQNKPVVNEVCVSEDAMRRQLAKTKQQKADLEARIKELEKMIVHTQSTTAAHPSKSSRRYTICASSLTRDPNTLDTPSMTEYQQHTTPRRVTFDTAPAAGISPGFTACFDTRSFERHLLCEEFTPLNGRPSFLPRPLDLAESDSTVSEGFEVDAEPLAADLEKAEAATQTDVDQNSHCGCGSILNSSLCTHQEALVHIKEELEMLQFLKDENIVSLEEKLQKTDADLQELAEDKYIYQELCQVSMPEEISQLKSQLYSLHQQLQKEPSEKPVTTDLLQLQQQLDLECAARRNLEKDIEQLKRQKELLQEELSGQVEKVHTQCDQECSAYTPAKQDFVVAQDQLEQHMSGLEQRLSISEESPVFVGDGTDSGGVVVKVEEGTGLMRSHSSENMDTASSPTTTACSLGQFEAPPSLLDERVASLEAELSQLNCELSRRVQMCSDYESQLQRVQEQMVTDMDEKERSMDRLRAECEKYKVRELECQLEHQAGLDDLYASARKSLDTERKIRHQLEQELEIQKSVREEKDMALQLLEKSTHEKEDMVVYLQKQLEATNLKMQSQLNAKETHLQDLVDAKALVQAQSDEECLKLRSLLQDAERRCENLSHEISELSQKEDTWISKVEKMRRDNARLLEVEEEYKHLDEVFRSQTVQLESTQESLQRKQHDVLQLQQVQVTLQQQADNLKSQHDCVLSQLQETEHHLQGTKEQLLVAESKAKSLEMSLEQSRSGYRYLKTSKAELEDLLQTAAASLRTKEEESALARSQLENITTELRTAEEQNTILTQEIEKMRRDNARLLEVEEEHKHLDKVFRSQTVQLESTQESLQRKQHDVVQLHQVQATFLMSQHDCVLSQLQETERHLQGTKEQLLVAESKAKSLEMNLRQGRSKCSSLKTSKAELEDLLQTAAASLRTKEEESALARSQLENITTDLRTAEEQNTILTQELQQSEEKCALVEKEVTALTIKVCELEHQASNPAAEHQIKGLRKENAQLRTKIQGMAAVPSGPPSLVVDGSGFVTGMEYYRMKADNSTLTKDNKELKAKLQKCREEFRQEYEKLKKEREECKRYRQERNIYRAKYDHIKNKYGITSTVEVESGDPTVPMLTEPLVSSKPDLGNLPSPNPPRKSILSFKPGQDLGCRRPKETREEAIGHENIHSAGLLHVHAKDKDKARFIWDQTLIESTATKSEEEPDQCKAQ